MRWRHLDVAAVGRWDGGNELTYVTTAPCGVTRVDNDAWTPDRPSPPPLEIRYDAWTSTLNRL
jgi:hypothetical protein